MCVCVRRESLKFLVLGPHHFESTKLQLADLTISGPCEEGRLQRLLVVERRLQTEVQTPDVEECVILPPLNVCMNVVAQNHSSVRRRLLTRLYIIVYILL